MTTNDPAHSRQPGGAPPPDRDQELAQHIVVTTVRGPIDLGVVTEVNRARLRCFSDIGEGAVASITVVQESLHITPDALERLREILQVHFAHACRPVFAACVAEPGLDGRNTAVPLIEAAYREVNVPWRCFNHLDEARVWITSMLSASHQPTRVAAHQTD